MIFHYFEIGTYTYYGKEYRIQIHSNMGLIDFAKGEVPVDIDPSLVLKEAFNTYNTLLYKKDNGILIFQSLILTIKSLIVKIYIYLLSHVIRRLNKSS